MNNNFENIYDIEITQNNYCLNRMECRFEDFKKWPTYQNNSIIQLIQQEKKIGKMRNKLKIGQPNQSIFFHSLFYSFKYTINHEEQEISKYYSSFSIHIFSNKLTVSFYDIQYKKEDIT